MRRIRFLLTVIAKALGVLLHRLIIIYIRARAREEKRVKNQFLCANKNREQVMKIAGLQKLTLLDYPGHTACTVFTAGCNFRCPFCHNSDLLRKNEGDISESEFFEFLLSRRAKLDGVCITGGEPLLQPDILRCLRQLNWLLL